MDRKSVPTDINEALFSHRTLNQRLINEIMYQLRKLMKLVRRVQTISIREGSEDYESIIKELNESKEVIERFENELENKK